MVAPPRRYLLDTNVVLAVARDGSLGQWIEATYQLQAALQVPLLSVVTVGEMLSLARQFNWSVPRTDRLRRLLARFSIVPLETEGVLEAYAMIDDATQRAGRPMGKNDVWIAATAHVSGTLLLTTDRDFDHLHPGTLTRDWIDPASHL